MTRHDDLVDAALDYVLAHGLVGLSLRPLAAALGTSDRMLIYHFGSKDRLVDEVLAHAQRRLAQSLAPPPPELRTLGDLIAHLWTSLTAPGAEQITRLYLETCLLATQDPRRHGDAPERLRGPWRAPLRAGLAAFGVEPDRLDALTDLVLDTFDGLALDRLNAPDPTRVDAAAATFATLLSSSAPPRP